MTDSLQPAFPPEIEQIIFSSAVRDNLKVAGKLCLVAKRVHEWLLPYIYEILAFDPDRDTAPNSKMSPDNLLKYGKHVRHLLFLGSATQIFQHGLEVYLEKCTNLITLALRVDLKFYTPQLMDVIARLQIKRFTGHIHAVFACLKRRESHSPIQFRTITHIEFVYRAEPKPRELKEYFPALTHLAIVSINSPHVQPIQEMLAAFGDQMKVLTWYNWEPIGFQSERPAGVIAVPGYLVLDDPRIVEVKYGKSFLATWYEETKGGSGIWRVADEVVKARYAAMKAG